MVLRLEAVEQEFVETCSLPDVWVDGIQKIEILSGGCYRFIFYRMRTDGHGQPYREAVACLVASSDVVLTAAGEAVAAVTKSTLRRLC